MLRSGVAPVANLYPAMASICVHAFEWSNMGNASLYAMVKAIFCDMGKPVQFIVMPTYLGLAGIAHDPRARAPRLPATRARV